jgi:hypothetical protein
LFPFYIFIYIKTYKKMDVLNYDNAVSAFNNLEAFQAEKQDQFKQLVQQYKEGAEQVILPAIDLFRRGKEAYNKLTGEKPAAEKPAAAEGEGATAEGEGAAVEAEGGETLDSLTSGVENVARNIGSEVSSRLGDFTSSIRGIGNQLSDRMRTNAFERDPEAEIASGEDNMGILDRFQSVFRGGVSEGENAVSGAVDSAKSAVSSAVSEGSEAVSGAVEGATSVAEGVGTAVAEGVGSLVADAIPVVGELSMLGLGIYDFVKGETAKAPVVQAFASPVLEKGI